MKDHLTKRTGSILNKMEDLINVDRVYRESEGVAGISKTHLSGARETFVNHLPSAIELNYFSRAPDVSRGLNTGKSSKNFQLLNNLECFHILVDSFCK